MPDKFDILVRDLERVRASGSSFDVFGEEAHNYESFALGKAKLKAIGPMKFIEESYGRELHHEPAKVSRRILCCKFKELGDV